MEFELSLTARIDETCISPEAVYEEVHDPSQDAIVSAWLFWKHSQDSSDRTQSHQVVLPNQPETFISDDERGNIPLDL